MNGTAVPADWASLRRLVLGVAFLLALAVGSANRAPLADAQPAPPAATKQADETPAKAPADAAPKPSSKGAKAAASPPAKTEAGADTGAEAESPSAEVTIGPRGVTVDRKGKRGHVFGIQGDRDYDSFDAFVQAEPWVGALVFFSVAAFFAVPVLIVIAIVWYKIRRARMLNDTVLKLAEKGVVPPPGALEALAANRPEAAAAALAAVAPPVEQIRYARRRAAWSDLRKGVVMLAIGLGLTLWSLMDDGSLNSVGIVLLFLGIGYVVLWWFEERQIAPPPSGGPATGA